MKTTFRSVFRLTVGGVALLLLMPAQAEKNKFYVEGEVGGAVTMDTQLKEFFGPVVPNSEVKFNPGMWLGLRGGYGLTDWFDAEVETGFVANEIDSITLAAETDAALANIPVLLNARFHCPAWHRVSPYFGGGLGVFHDDIVGRRSVNCSPSRQSDHGWKRRRGGLRVSSLRWFTFCDQ